MIYLNLTHWFGSFRPPPRQDVRWVAFGLLLTYVFLGLFVLGFSRKPQQVLLVLGYGMALDVLLSGFLKGKRIFPLSAGISCLSLAILLNYSYGFQHLWVPVFIAIASKYVITFNGRHVYNPSMFGICVSLLLGSAYITLAPSYQWYGSAGTAWMMGVFIATAAVFLFLIKIRRMALVVSFLLFYTLQTALRAYFMQHIIPVETLFVGALTSPAFYLFTFYMITDPATSPASTREQIWAGFFIAFFDLLFHLKFSLFTFFYAGLTFATFRFLLAIVQKARRNELKFALPGPIQLGRKLAIVTLCGLPALFALTGWRSNSPIPAKELPFFQQIPSKHSGLGSAPGDILQQTDPRVAHVAKWVLSVGDAVASADIDNDGDADLFLTQPLKATVWQAKLYLNQGDFKFQKLAIPDLERYLGDPKTHGLPGFGLFWDYDNDGDQDLFVGFGFGKSHLFENQLIQSGHLSFTEKSVPFLENHHTVCLAANALDFDKDGKLDLFLTNTLPPYLPDYDRPTPLNIFKLPPATYPGDRRMFHFMHESWHNADNGGPNYLLLNRNGTLQALDNQKVGLTATRWSLSVGTLDLNGDGFTDLYVANDFGRDDCYLNIGGKRLERQQGNFYGDIGLDTYKGMNASAGDLDRNGKEDLYVSNVHHAMQAEGSLLWLNHTSKGAKKVALRESATRLNLLNPNRFGWGAAFADLNLDGWLDVVQANGMVGDAWDKRYPKRMDYWYLQAQIARTGPEIHSYADNWADIRGASIYENESDGIFINQRGENFIDVAVNTGFIHKRNTRGVAAVDLDNDGDPDLVVTDQFGEPLVYENKMSGQAWVGLQLKGNGVSCSRDAVGTKVWVSYEEDGKKATQYREVHLANGFAAQGDRRLLFGLGKSRPALRAMSVRIQWHDGTWQELGKAPINRYHRIEQGEVQPAM